MKNKKVVWVSYGQDDTNKLSFEECLKRNSHIGELWLVDADQPLSDLWGDDWNDAPADYNAGPPYEDRCKGLVKIQVTLGKELTDDGTNTKKHS